MPFTFSHPALVIPLTLHNRKWFSLTGLVVGSIIPDFEYFLRMKTQSNYSHTLTGMFWFDLPLALAVAFLFHNVVRNMLIANLPEPLKARFIGFMSFDWNPHFKRHGLVVVGSILIGAASHLFWDSFTHASGWFVQQMPALQNHVALASFKVPAYKLAQHASTVLGALVIAISIFKMPKNKTADCPVNSRYWALIMLLTMIIVTARVLLGLDVRLYGHLIVSCISALLLSLIITPLVLGAAVGLSR